MGHKVDLSSAPPVLAALRRFSIENDRFDAAVARRYGITEADLHALEHLQLGGGLTPGQLGERLQLTSGSVTALADRLERAGLLERVPHATDRRSTMLRLTSRSAAFAHEAYGPFAEDMRAAVAELPAEHHDAVIGFLDAAAAVCAEHAARQAAVRAAG